MPSQLLMSTRPSTLSPKKPVETAQAQSQSASKTEATMKSVYSVDQQVKFLHLQAEVETLLLRLQTLQADAHANANKQQRSDRPS